MTRKRPEFKPHDDYIFGLKKTAKVTREEFMKFIRSSLEHMRELSQMIRQYSQTIELFEEAESVRVSNEAERISKDSERDSKIEAVEGLQADFDSLDNVFHNTIQTNAFKVITCSLSELDNIREVYFEEQPNDNISYIAIVHGVDILSVWGTERKSSTIDNRYQLRIRRHSTNYLQSRYYGGEVSGWGDWVN